MDTNSPEFQAALRDHARSLGVDPDAEPFLLNLVQEALLAEVPDGWEQGETEDGTLYYFNTATEESIWEHPLDAHYRDLIKQKKADAAKPAKPPPTTTPVAAPAVEQQPAKAEVSKLEVYSFDDDSDDEAVKPTSKPATDRSSRLSSLFDPKPAPSYSATSAAITSSLANKPAAATPTPTANSSSTNKPVGGFGRDRSWLLDNDDDVAEIPTLSSTPTATTVSTTRPSTAAALSSFKATTATDSDSVRPTTAASSLSAFSNSNNSSSSSYTARLFGTNNSTATGTATVSSVDLSPPTQDTNKLSPRRGIASTIKDRFFDDLAPSPSTPATASSSVSSSSASVPSSSTANSAASTLADLQTIRELEKKLGDVTNQLATAKTDADSLRQQLEATRAEAKEANYLKMKANEHKTKLADKDTELARTKSNYDTELARTKSNYDAELARLKTDHTDDLANLKTNHANELAKVKADLVALQDELRRTNDECATLKRSQQTRQADDGQTRELQALLRASDQRAEGLARDLQQLSATNSASESQWLATKSALEKDVAAWKAKHEALQSTLDREMPQLRAELNESEGRVRQRESELQTLRGDLAAKEKVALELQDKLQSMHQSVGDAQAKTLAWKRTEDEWERKRAQLARQLEEKTDHASALQRQLDQAQNELASRSASAKVELQALQNELKTVQTSGLLPLEKHNEQLQREHERLQSKLASADQELRQTQQELAHERSQSHQLSVEIDAWKRKEQQQKSHKDAYFQEKLAIEKQLQSLQGEASAAAHSRRLEVEKLAFRVRELEAQVAQREYDALRMEERFATAESWRVKEAKRVETRDAELLSLKEELAQVKGRNVEAENSAIMGELRREKDQLAAANKALALELEAEKTARVVAAQKFQDQLDHVQQGLEWQLPQLAAACVSRSSDEWTRKCHELVAAVRDEWAAKALAERAALVERLRAEEERRDHAEGKLKTAVSECEFLRKEVHRVEDNNKVLLDQLHTIRVYLTQRSGVGVGGVGGWMAPTAPTPTPTSTTTTAPTVGDATTVNQLNAHLSVLHAQFQQLFEAHAPAKRMSATYYSPSDRFEIPSSPPARHKHRRGSTDASDLRSPRTTASSSPASSAGSPLDRTLDSLLDAKLPKNRHLDQEQELLRSLEALGGSSTPTCTPTFAPTPTRTPPPTSDSLWYQKNYWKAKYHA